MQDFFIDYIHVNFAIKLVSKTFVEHHWRNYERDEQGCKAKYKLKWYSKNHAGRRKKRVSYLRLKIFKDQRTML